MATQASKYGERKLGNIKTKSGRKIENNKLMRGKKTKVLYKCINKASIDVYEGNFGGLFLD